MDGDSYTNLEKPEEAIKMHESPNAVKNPVFSNDANVTTYVACAQTGIPSKHWDCSSVEEQAKGSQRSELRRTPTIVFARDTIVAPIQCETEEDAEHRPRSEPALRQPQRGKEVPIVNRLSSRTDVRSSSDAPDDVRCAIYTRVSTPGQVEDGVSLELQKERLEAYAKSYGWTVTRYYEDAGFSGSTTKRPALQRMLEDARTRQFDRILIYKIDRLSRSVTDFYALSDKLAGWGVGLVSTTQQYDSSTAQGKLMQNILVSFAGFERDIIVERTKDAEARLKEQGKLVCGPAPFGFRHDDKKLQYDPETFPVAKEILRRVSSGEPERAVARSLGLTRDQIRSVLHNPLFAGKIAYKKRDEKDSRLPYNEWMYVDYPGIEPILAFDDWIDLQQELGLRSDRSGGQTLPLFGRMIYCTKCGHLLSAHGSSKHNKTKYACQSAGNGQEACGDQLWEHCLLPVFVTKLSQELCGFVPRFDGAERLAETDRKITKYDRDIAQLEGRLAIPEVSVKKVRERIAEIRGLKHEALQERAQIDQEKMQLDEVKKVLGDFEPFFYSLDRASQLEVVHRFARRIDLEVTNIVIHWRFSETDCTVGRLEVSPKARKKGHGGRVVEIGGLEPPTSCMPCRRSPS